MRDVAICSLLMAIAGCAGPLEKSAGADNPKVARVLNNIGNVYIATGEYTKALDSHRRAHAIFESKLGPYNDVTLLSLGNIAKTYMASGDAAA